MSRSGDDNLCAMSQSKSTLGMNNATYLDHHLEFGDFSKEQRMDLESSSSLTYGISSPNPHSNNQYTPDDYGTAGFVEEEDELPLLEELGIDPDRILQKTMAVLNPFHKQDQIDDADYLLQDSDLAGPSAFCLLLAAFLLLAGSQAHFGYVYGLAVTSCILMYILHYLMSNTENVTLSSTASVLGYCILPIVIIAGISIFVSLRGPFGLFLSAFAVSWATVSSSRLFCAMSSEKNQRLLIAYPCLLLYGVFTLIVIF